jgi:hypothetical protein
MQVKDHPLRALRVMADAALVRLGPAFDAIYARSGRPSIAREYGRVHGRREINSSPLTDAVDHKRSVLRSPPRRRWKHPGTNAR